MSESTAFGSVSNALLQVASISEASDSGSEEEGWREEEGVRPRKRLASSRITWEEEDISGRETGKLEDARDEPEKLVRGISSDMQQEEEEDMDERDVKLLVKKKR